LPPLADLQHAFARAVLDRAQSIDGAPPLRGRIPPAAALDVHQGTVFAGLIGSLRISLPTVNRLVGERFFDQAALAFIARDLPRPADLCLYGAGFAGFLAGYAPAADLAYLADVARLDFAIARALQGPGEDRRRALPIDADVALSVPLALILLPLDHPVIAIRDALDAGDDKALAVIDLRPEPHFAAVWRGGRGAHVRKLSGRPGEFLAALLEGGQADEALARALGAAPQDAVLAAIQSEVFDAPFARITPLFQD